MPLLYRSAALAVDLFFVLSGFVLAYAYEGRFRAAMTPAEFIKARLIRQYPLYLIGTLLGIVEALLLMRLGISEVHWTWSRFWTSLPFSLAMLPAPDKNLFPIGTNNISIIDRALAPGAPFKPNLRLNILVGLFLGLLLGALTAFMLEQLEEAAVLPADFQRKFGIPLFGATPKLTDAGRVQESLLEPKSPLSEAYFSILTSVQFSTAHGTPSSFMMTSAQAREGKSTTAVALAQALTGVGAKVLLIDADMRNPSLHKILGRSLGNGLSNLLTGSGTLDEVTQPSQTPNLSVVMAGHIPPNPAELLSTEAIDRIIAEATSKYDHVVVDGPPILGLADAPLLTRSVEATILVVESGRTRATQARHAIDRLLAVRANVIGAVLSKFDVQNSGYGYGYGYGHDYDYAYSYGAR